MAGTTMRREAELSYELHRAVVPYLRRDWPSAEEKIRANISRFNRRPRAKLAQGWVREWECAVDQGPDAVATVALSSGERGDDLRQVSPLAGVLPQEVRLQVLQQVRGRSSRGTSTYHPPAGSEAFLNTPEGRRPETWQESAAYVRALGAGEPLSPQRMEQRHQEQHIEQVRTIG